MYTPDDIARMSHEIVADLLNEVIAHKNAALEAHEKAVTELKWANEKLKQKQVDIDSLTAWIDARKK